MFGGTSRILSFLQTFAKNNSVNKVYSLFNYCLHMCIQLLFSIENWPISDFLMVI